MMLLATQKIEPMGEWVFGAEVGEVEMGLDMRVDDGGGVVLMEQFYTIDLWELGAHYWMEIGFVVGLLLFVIGAVGLWRRRGWLRDVKDGEAYCGRCGYGLMGLKEDGDVCVECGREQVGDGGKYRKVRRKRWVSWKRVRWGLVCLGLVMLLTMGDLIVGARRDWGHVDWVARKLGVERDVFWVGVVTGYARPTEKIRYVGLRDWFSLESRWACRLFNRLSWGYRVHGVSDATNQWLDVSRVMMNERELGYVRMEMGEADLKYREIAASTFFIGQRVRVLVGVDGEVWYYVKKNSGFRDWWTAYQLRGDGKLIEYEMSARMRLLLEGGNDDWMNSGFGIMKVRVGFEEQGEWWRYELGDGVYVCHGVGGIFESGKYLAGRMHCVVAVNEKQRKIAAMKWQEIFGKRRQKDLLMGVDQWAEMQKVLDVNRREAGWKEVHEVLGDAWLRGSDQVTLKKASGLEVKSDVSMNFTFARARGMSVASEGTLFWCDEDGADASRGDVEVMRDVGMIDLGDGEVKGARLDGNGMLYVVLLRQKVGYWEWAVRVYDVREILKEIDD
ncbi:hypothetical protein JD969_12510 [Planctomycetota bacterium]|nr:hypothetical protein JD969_12510 [Planctomycetota bacterium]